MNKKELVAAIAEQSGLTQNNANTFLDAFMRVVCEEVRQGGEVNIIGYLKFSQIERKARMAHNPKTGEAISVPATKSVKIQAGSKLKAAAKGE